MIKWARYSVGISIWPSAYSTNYQFTNHHYQTTILPDFRVRQRDYLLEIARLLTQELDFEKPLARILKIAIEMLAGQAGLIALKETEG